MTATPDDRSDRPDRPDATERLVRVPSAPPLAARAAQVVRELSALARELATAFDVPLDGPDAARELDLRLRLPLGPLNGDGAALLLDALGERLRRLQDPGDTVVPGRVYCFQCRRSDCGHAAPPDARHVFLAYSATGKPVWRELTEACLAWGEPRVDLLYGDPPAVVAVQRSGPELAGELIAGFGRDERTYRLLGQVACGYLAISAGAGGPGRGALTLQVVGSRSGGGPLRLHLNPVGLEAPVEGRNGRPAWWEQRALSDTIREAREQLRALALRVGRRRGGIRQELEEGVAAVLGRLRSALERRYRPQAHRTQHARERQREGGRPTHVAVADAERAPEERLLWEPERETLIVLGPKGRVHVFAEDGRHVTSLHHTRESIERRCDRKQWVPCDAQRMARFRAAIAALAR
jgi:hypothetical protein